jgi:hypothetical protein
MDRQYVGIDFHRRRSVIVRNYAAGEKLCSVRVANDPLAIAAVVAEAGLPRDRLTLLVWASPARRGCLHAQEVPARVQA